MTSLDETDGAGGTNAALDGLRALAYEGPPSEVAANFKSQGNERVAERRWGDAREFYSRALEVLAGKDGRGGGVEGEVDWLGGSEGRVVDLEEEERAARGLEEVCAVNRARCHLELSMCIRLFTFHDVSLWSCGFLELYANPLRVRLGELTDAQRITDRPGKTARTPYA